MIKTTIEEALYGDVEGYTYNNGHVIYLVRETDIVFYVGHSTDPLTRLEQHLGADYIGTLIRHFAPASLLWEFEMRKLEDCGEFLDVSHLKYDDRRHRERVERVLIEHYRPCCNKAGNGIPTPLPEKYQTMWRIPEIKVGLTNNLY